MTKQILKGTRAKSKQELSKRRYLYFEEVNRESVIYHRTDKPDEISPQKPLKLIIYQMRMRPVIKCLMHRFIVTDSQ